MTRKRFRKLLRAINSELGNNYYRDLVNQLRPGGNKKCDNYYLAWCIVLEREMRKRKWHQMLGWEYNCPPAFEVEK